MVDNKFTEKVQAWLEAPESARDYAQGALFFLQLSNNKIMYHNMMLNLPKYREVIEYQIRKYMKFRLAQLTHAQVEQMQTEVDRIVAAHFAFAEKSDTKLSLDTPAEKSAGKSTVSAPHSTPSEEYAKGKRADHDSLPAEIQALYVENLTLLHEMRELHMQLRHLSTENSTCPDSERYPFLKALIAKDKQYHKNWQLYDHYSAEGSATQAEQTLVSDIRMDSKQAQRQINLLKGRYRKKPTEEMKQKIQALYAQLLNPTESLTAELKELGIL